MLGNLNKLSAEQPMITVLWLYLCKGKTPHFELSYSGSTLVLASYTTEDMFPKFKYSNVSQYILFP